MTIMTNYTYYYQNNINPEHKSVNDYASILFCRLSKVSILSCD